MKTFSRLFALLMIVVMIGAIAVGCRNSNENSNSAASSSETTTALSQTSAAKSEKTKAAKVKVKNTKTTAATAKSTTKQSTTAPDKEPEREKIIYLTVDDGPYRYTEDVLKILKKNHVKATFFVTNAYPGYAYCIKKEAKAGHVIGVHTYSHNYSKIYSSTDAYWKDFDKMNSLIEKETGHKTDLFRFPGGSSNLVSRRYKKGIMTKLAKQAEEKGYTYFDWNVISGDAGETTDPDEVYEYITEGVKQHDQSIVLCHDIKPYTVEALDRTIKWCLRNGYRFETLTSSGYNVHHTINN